LYSLRYIADIIQAKLIGNEQYLVSSPAKIEEASENNISFLSNEKYLNFIEKSEIGAILISSDIYNKIINIKHLNNIKGGFLIVEDAYAVLPKLLALFDATSDEAFSIGKNTKIFPNVYIGKNVKIGDNCIIYPNVCIYDNCIIGNNVIVHAGAVIGADGFGFAPQKDGTFQKIAQIGNVILENDCEIGANTCIDRATMGSTIIRKGVKLDNLIQVGHNVEIGEHTVIAAQTGIAGSTKIANNCMIGGQVGFVGHISIAPFTKINAQSGIAQSIKFEKSILGGSPAFELKDFFKASIVFKSLPQMQQKIILLEQEIKALKQQQKSLHDK
jgi:UDP-3-O-[3-hydroxymyristoyl] glucosamine N-acyltransferase